MTTLSSILNEIANAFTKDKRNDGTVFHRLKDDAPKWMTIDASVRDMSFMLRVHSAVDDRGPDDWIYASAASMSQWLAENSEWHDRNGREWDSYEAVNECADSETDVYTMDRLKWLASNLNNLAVCDEVAEDSGTVGISDQIVQGQAEALRRIGAAIVELAREELAAREEAE